MAVVNKSRRSYKIRPSLNEDVKQPVAVKLDDVVDPPPSLRLSIYLPALKAFVTTVLLRPTNKILTVLKDAADGYQTPHGSPPQMYDHILPLLNCSRSVCEGGRSIRLIWLSSSARPPEPSTKPFGELIKVLVLVLVRKWKERWVRRPVDGWRYEQIGVDGRLERKSRIDVWSYGRLQHTPPQRKMDVRGASRWIQVGRVKASG
ncbi:uncharacterized protein ARMOST_12303 [Armillaria ostoyae]|uniref:Uncharacterized protein n=1 Tax=Armillaria ostoyae TaxID=47428 RepID=A0A284RJI9_ARMOS|nr:uncharacterized protein ARMOST_12303 [Armillaria ostoyae]